MSKNFKDISFPKTLKVSSDGKMIPLDFFGEVIPLSKKIQFKLGFFSSNSISTLSYSFAQFIYNGGSMDFLINHFLSDEDYKLINDEIDVNTDFYKKIEDQILNDLIKLNDVLTKKEVDHFFNCLRYLIEKERLNIIPVTTSSGEVSHYKEGLFWDNNENIINIIGSCNFTYKGLVCNGESFKISRSWGEESETETIKEELIAYKDIFDKKSKEFNYLNPQNLINIVKNNSTSKEIKELLTDEFSLVNDNEKYSSTLKKLKKQFEKAVELNTTKTSQIPTFPYIDPYPYQKTAQDNWVKKGHKGLFAMATGTGKTLTSIYCLIKEFEKTNLQKNIIVVPGEELVRQWGQELKDCNFKSVFLWFSKNKNLKKEIELIRVLKNSDALNIVITYDSFKESKEFESVFKNDFTNYIVVFDEAHNMGSFGFRESNANKKFKKVIGLSATPMRLWDEDNENQFIEDFFDSPPPYTFSFGMAEAIQNKFLCKYNYFPYFTHLNDNEWNEYLAETNKMFLGGDNKINTFAALRRQAILDQALSKTNVFIKILRDLYETKNYKYTLVYCPKGERTETRIIYRIGEAVRDNFKGLINSQFFLGETTDRDVLLSQFENGEVDLLLAIKCLDEGVNVPKTMNAIFLASGKNYREFVQRRGRVLRKYEKGDFKKEHANIYDIVVIPTLDQYEASKNTAKKLIVYEFKRLFEFYKMAEVNEDVFWKIENELEKYGLTQYYLESIIKDNE